MTKVGSGRLTLTGSNTYTGGTTISAGTLSIGNGSSAESLASPTITDNGALVFNHGDLLTYSGVIGGTGSLTKQGVGTLTLTGSNTYTGTTTLSGGTLNLGAAETPGLSGPLGSSTASSSIVLNGGYLQYSAVNQYDYSSRFSTANNQAYNVDTNGQNVTWAAALTSSGGSLTKVGAGMLTLTASNSYSGATTVSGGTLDLGNQYALQNSTLSINGGAAVFDSSVLANAFTLGGLDGTAGNLVLQNNAATPAAIALTVGGNNASTACAVNLGGSGSLTKVGSGTLTLTGSNTYSGTTTLSAGTVNLGAAENAGVSGPLGSSTAAGSIVLGGGCLQYSAVNQYDYSSRFSTAASQAYNVDTNGQTVTWATPLVSASGSLTKVGSGMLTLTGSNTYTGGTTISTGTLQIGNGTTDGSIAASSGVSVANNAVLMVNLIGNQTYGGGISGAGGLSKSGAGMLTLAGNDTYYGPTSLGAGTLNITGNINPSTGSGDLFTGTAPVTINLSNGQVIFKVSGSSTYSGGTTITGGSANTLVVYNNSTGTSGNFGTGTINLVGSNTVFMRATSNNSVTIGNAVTLGASLTDPTATPANNLTFTGPVTLSGSSQTLENDNGGGVLLAFSGGIGDGGNGYGLTKAGTGTIVLAGSNTYTGATNINVGTLSIGNGGSGEFLASPTVSDSGTLTFNHGDALTYSGTISGGGAVTKTGSGALTLTANNSYSGGTTVSAGTLTLTGGNTGTGGTTVSGGTLDLSNEYALQNSTITVSGGSLTFDSSVAGNAFAVGGLAAGNVALQNNAALPAAVALTLGGSNLSTTCGANLSGLGSLTKVGSGTLTLTGSNTFSGGVTLTAGTLEINSSAALGTGTFTIAAGMAIDNTSSAVLTNANNNPQTWNGNFTFLGAGHSLNLGTGAVTLGANCQVTVNANSLYVGGIGDGGIGYRLTKAGAGTLLVTGSSGYSGGTTVNAGILELQNANALGTPSAAITLAANAAIALGGNITTNPAYAITINGNSTNNLGQLQNDAGNNTWAGPVTLAAAGSFNRIGANSGTLTVSGQITGSGGLLARNETGTAGTVVLSNSANNYTGGTEVYIGTLQLGANNAVPPAGGLNIAPANSGTQQTGTFDLNGYNQSLASLACTQAPSYATLTNSNTSVLSTVTLSNTASDTYGGNITGNLAFVLNGSSTLLLSGTDTYTGGTTVSGGTLQVGSALALGATTGSVTVTSATLDLHGYSPTVGALTGNAGAVVTTLSGSNAFTLTTNTTSATTFAGTFQNNGGTMSLVKAGSGTLTLTGTSNYTGTTSVNAGTLEFTTIANENAGKNTSLGNPATGNGQINLAASGAATLRYIGNGNNSTSNRVISLAGNGATLDASGLNGGALVLGSAAATTTTVVTATVPNTNLTLTGSTEGDLLGRIDANIGAVTKNGSGLWVLGGSNSFAGPTTINAGWLQLTNTAASSLGSGAVFVSGGTLDASVNPQTIGPLTVYSGGALNLTYGKPLTVSGTAVLGGTLNLSGSTSGPEDLINYSALSASSSFSAVTNVPSGYGLQYTPTQLDLVASTNATMYSLAASTTASLLHVNDSASVTTTITNVGTGQPDALNYAGLGVSGSGTVLGPTGSSSSALSPTYSASNTQTFTASVPGIITLTPGVSSASNATIGGSATLSTTSGATINVFSGSGTWTGNSSTSWSASSNWTDSNHSGVKVAPGTFSNFTNTDVATFDVTTSGGTITLDNAAPSLAAINFSNSNATYTIAQGSGGTLTLNGRSGLATVTISGTQAISAPILLSSSASFVPADGAQLTLSGNLGDNGNNSALVLAASGALESGSLILSGTNTYGGGTYVEAGTLIVTASDSVQDGTTLTVGAGGMFLFDPTAAGASMDATALPAAARVNPVPEPGMLALLLAALCSAMIYRRFR